MTHKAFVLFIALSCIISCSEDPIEPLEKSYTVMFNTFYETF